MHECVSYLPKGLPSEPWVLHGQCECRYTPPLKNWYLGIVRSSEQEEGEGKRSEERNIYWPHWNEEDGIEISRRHIYVSVWISHIRHIARNSFTQLIKKKKDK